MSQRISASLLDEAVMEVLAQYKGSAIEALNDACKAVADNAVAELKSTSPKKTGAGGGDYAKDWAKKLDKSDDVRVSYVVYNKKHYRLTHLLEHGHAKKSGGRTRKFPHIAPVADNAEEKIVEELQKELTNK